MLLRNTLIAGCGLAALVFAATTARSTPAAQTDAAAAKESETYAIDSGHSSVVFKIKHLDVAWFYGRFNQIEGTYVLDPADPTKSSVRLEIPTASIDTNSADRDAEMRSAGFFDAEGHPSITFESKEVEVVEEGHWKVHGELVCKGKTRAIEVDMHSTGASDHPRFGYRTGFEGSFEFQRSDFDIAAGMPESMLGDSVQVLIGIEGQRQ